MQKPHSTRHKTRLFSILDRWSRFTCPKAREVVLHEVKTVLIQITFKWDREEVKGVRAERGWWGRNLSKWLCNSMPLARLYVHISEACSEMQCTQASLNHHIHSPPVPGIRRNRKKSIICPTLNKSTIYSLFIYIYHIYVCWIPLHFCCSVYVGYTPN